MKKFCPTCGSALEKGKRIKEVCTKCHPSWLAHCTSCHNELLNCTCSATSDAKSGAAPGDSTPCTKCGATLLRSKRYGHVCAQCNPMWLSPCSCGHPAWDCVCGSATSLE